MSDRKPDGQLLAALACQGNHRVARAIIRDSGRGPGPTVELLKLVDRHAPAAHSVLAPLPYEAGSHGLLCAVELVAGSGHSPALEGAHEVEVVEAALTRAWELVGGVGQRPDLSLRLELPERMGLPVRGDSLQLPVLIAAVSAFSGVELHRNVVATGALDGCITMLEHKRALARNARRFLGIEEVLVATTVVQGPEGLPGVRYVLGPEEGVKEVFGYLPWHAEADVRRVHMYSARNEHEGKERGPWPAGTYLPVGLPFPLAPADLDAALARLWEAVGDHRRVEVSLAAPVLLSARLGWELKNRPHNRILVVFGTPPRPWWLNGRRIGTAPAGGCPVPRAGRRKILVTVHHRPVEGWEMFTVTPTGNEDLRPASLPRIVSDLQREVANATALDVAIEGPYPLAWAVAQGLRHVKKTDFYHWTGSTYERWFGDGGDA